MMTRVVDDACGAGHEAQAGQAVLPSPRGRGRKTAAHDDGVQDKVAGVCVCSFVRLFVCVFVFMCMCVCLCVQVVKIKWQAQKLVKTLLECSPHYVRTVKSNETKSKKTFDRERVLHQVQAAAAAAVTCVTRSCPCRSNTWGCWRTSRWAPVQRLHIPSDTHVYP
jgi:hypothetical protein